MVLSLVSWFDTDLLLSFAYTKFTTPHFSEPLTMNDFWEIFKAFEIVFFKPKVAILLVLSVLLRCTGEVNILK